MAQDHFISFLALRAFVQNQTWEDETGNRFNRDQKRQWINAMNNNALSDMAAITYCPNSDFVELWYTKINPFSQQGIWAVIPGIRRCIRQIEYTERLQDRRN